MAEPIVSIAVSDQKTKEALTRLQSRVKDLSPALRDIGEFMLLQHDLRFEREVDFRGNPLQPLSKRTIEKKRAEGKILKILQRTGLMRSRTAYKITDQSVTITNNDVKARKHQFGIGVPKREIFGTNPNEDTPEILEILQEYING